MNRGGLATSHLAKRVARPPPVPVCFLVFVMDDTCHNLIGAKVAFNGFRKKN
jgi:hypothetical protein